MCTVLDAYKNFINLKRKDNESLIDYSRGFKAACDVLQTEIGDTNFINLKQREDESLIIYTRQFKAARDVLQMQIGDTMVFPGYSDTLKQAKFKLPEPALDPSKMKNKTTIVGERINKEDKEA